MGAWGVSILSDDYARDIIADYLEMLRKKNSPEDATKKLIERERTVFGTEDEITFWAALAIKQWKLGELLPSVKEHALEALENDAEDDRWRDTKTKEARAKAVEKIRQTLLSDPPPKKKVYGHRVYRCPWQLGDVFAYQFHDPIAKERGVEGKYIVFRKITETTSWPGNIEPVVEIYRWIGDTIPTLEAVQSLPTMPMKSAARLSPLVDIMTSSKREVPMEYLTYIGNIQDDSLFPMTNERTPLENPILREKCFTSWWSQFEIIFLNFNAWWEKETKPSPLM